MNNQEILDALKEIKAEGRKAEKEALLDGYMKDDTFLKVLVYALDQFKMFGIAKVSAPKSIGDLQIKDNYRFWNVLDKLASREYSGNHAQTVLSNWQGVLDEPGQEILKRILTKKPDIGGTVKTLNRVRPGLITTFDCMLAHPYKEERHAKRNDWPIWVEPKLDGVRVLAFVEDSGVKFFSRSGKEYTSFDHLVEPLMETAKTFMDNFPEMLIYGGFVFDGEIVSGSFNKTVSEVRRKSAQATDAKFYIFDMLPIEVFRDDGYECELGYTDRRDRLAAFRTNASGVAGEVLKIIPSFLANDHDQIMNIYDQMRSKGLEGVIVKPGSHKYVRKRSHDWAKIKDCVSADVRIVSAFEGEGKYVGMLGGVIVDFEGVEVRVGGGLSDDQRQSFWSTYINELKEKNGGTYEDTGDTLLGRLVEVEYHEVTPDGSLRHPRFIRFRDDKDMKAA